MLKNEEIDSTLQIASVICGSIILVVGMIGIFGDIVTLIIFTRPRMVSSVSVLICGLSVTNILMIVFAVAAFVVQAFSTLGTSIQLELYIAYIPKTSYPVAMMVQTASLWLIVAITVERFLVVKWPFLSRKVCTVFRSKMVITVIVILSIIYNMVRFWEYSILTTVAQEPNGSDSEVLAVPNLIEGEAYFAVYYTGCFLLSHFLVPFTALVILNTGIVLVIRKAQCQRTRICVVARNEHSLALMMVTITVLFLVCNTTPFTLNIIEAVNRNFFIDNSTRTMAYLLLDISNCLVLINGSVDTVVYYAFNARYRLWFRRLLYCTRSGLTVTYQIHRSVSVAVLPLRLVHRYAPLLLKRQSASAVLASMDRNQASIHSLGI